MVTVGTGNLKYTIFEDSHHAHVAIGRTKSMKLKKNCYISASIVMFSLSSLSATSASGYL